MHTHTTTTTTTHTSTHTYTHTHHRHHPQFPIVICTDDSANFCSDLSNELFPVAQALDLDSTVNVAIIQILYAYICITIIGAVVYVDRNTVIDPTNY